MCWFAQRTFVKHKLRQCSRLLWLNPPFSLFVQHTAWNQLTSFHPKQQTERGCYAALRVKLPSCRSHEPSPVRRNQIPPQSPRTFRVSPLSCLFFVCRDKTLSVHLACSYVRGSEKAMSKWSSPEKKLKKWNKKKTVGCSLLHKVQTSPFLINVRRWERVWNRMVIWAHTVIQGIRMTVSIMAEGFPFSHDPETCGEMAPSVVSRGKQPQGWVRIKQIK